MSKTCNSKIDCAEAQLALSIARKIVDGTNGSISALIKDRGVDWARFKDLVSYHGLVPFIYPILKGDVHLLPESLVKTTEATYYYSMAHTLRLQQKFLELHSAFREKGILIVPIKGMALLEELYFNCPVRPSVDIDILVKEKELEKACYILEDLGYKKELEGLKESYWRDKQYHFIFTKKDLQWFSPIVELHWDLDYRRKRRQLLPEMFKRLRDFFIHNEAVKLISVEDTFFSLALHQRRFGLALSLRNVCDMAILLNKYQADFDWDYVLRESKKSLVCSTIFFALCQINLFFEVNIPKYVYRELRIPVWKKKIIQLFIKKNTFLPNQNKQLKNLYLKVHFLLYDNMWEPIDYILNIPREQFSKFYGLLSYDKKTDFFYRYRLFYIFF